MSTLWFSRVPSIISCSDLGYTCSCFELWGIKLVHTGGLQCLDAPFTNVSCLGRLRELQEKRDAYCYSMAQ